MTAKRLFKYVWSRKPGLITQSHLADFIFKKQLADRLFADARKFEASIVRALNCGAAVEMGSLSVSVKRNRLKITRV